MTLDPILIAAPILPLVIVVALIFDVWVGPRCTLCGRRTHGQFRICSHCWQELGD